MEQNERLTKREELIQRIISLTDEQLDAVISLFEKGRAENEK